MKGTKKLHRILTSSHLKHNQMHVKKYSCLCISRQNSEHVNCINCTTFQNYTKPKLVTLKSSKKEIKDDDAEGDEDEDKGEESDEEDGDEITWEESDAVQMIKEGDDDFRDDYGHLYLKGQTVLSENYLEEFQSKNESRLFFRDTRKVAVVSSFCIACISSELIQSKGHQRKKVVDYFEINEYVHEVLLGLVTGLDA